LHLDSESLEIGHGATLQRLRERSEDSVGALEQDDLRFARVEVAVVAW
jgi:hypothetical protein